MNDLPRTPMHPDELPQQRVTLVADLPPRPEGFEGTCCFADGGNIELPDITEPKQSTELGGVEWAWSPAHSRLDNYFIERRGGQWLLWIGFEDENSWDRDWTWVLYCFAEYGDADGHAAAVYLLHDAWADEASRESIDHFHWVNHEGVLSVSDLTAIARSIWGEQGT